MNLLASIYNHKNKS